MQLNKYTHTHTHTSTDPIRLLCIRLALPLTISLPSRFAPSAKLVVGVLTRALWLAGAFSCDCAFWDRRGGVLTRQPVGPPVNTAAITTAMSINHVDSGSFSSRCYTFRRTRTSADLIRILCIQLALTLTLSWPSRFVPSARLMIGASPRTPRFVWDFSCDYMFWGETGGRLTGQPVGPQVDTETIAPSARLIVCVSPRVLWLVRDFLCDCMFYDQSGGGLTGQPVGPQVNMATIRTVLSTHRVNSRSLDQDIGRSGVHIRAKTVFGYFVSD